MILLYTLLILFFLFLLNLYNKKKAKDKKCIYANEVKEIKKYPRSTDHDSIYKIYSFIVLFTSLKKVTNFYDYEKVHNDIFSQIDGINRLKESPFFSYNVSVAVRYYKFCSYYKKMKYKITRKTIKYILYPETIFTINRESQLLFLLEEYKEYWDNVLKSYKRKHAYINRLNYLVNNLEMIKGKSYIDNYPIVIKRITELQNVYTKQLS